MCFSLGQQKNLGKEKVENGFELQIEDHHTMRENVFQEEVTCEVMVWFKYDISNSDVGEDWGQVLLQQG